MSAIEALLAKLSIEEMVQLLSGRDFWSTAAIPRLGIPSVKVTDGPNGARGGGALVGGVKAAAFPVGIALAASWNVDLVGEIGAALALEAKSKGARILLAPTVNLHRSALNGRNFECYSEDPFLTAEIAVAYIIGLQAQGVGAAVKHFIGNESEFQRASISSDIDERSLREIYFLPFEAAVKRGKTFAIMASYNKLNGTYVHERRELIEDLLRREWGFDGLVMSDWFGTKSTSAPVNAGLDLEMPGPARYRGAKLLAAHQTGEVTNSAITAAARNVLRLADRIGAFEQPGVEEERADDRPETRALIRRAGAEGMVLLKNDGVLPLAPKAGMTIAAIGPNAQTAQIMGGGSAQINPHYSVSPFEGLSAALPKGVSLVHEKGCANHRLAPLLTSPARVDFYSGQKFAGPIKLTKSVEQAFIMLMGEEAAEISPRDFSARMRTSYVATQSGEHVFSLIATGPCRLFVNGELTVDGGNWTLGEEFFSTSCDEVVARRSLEAGVTYELTAELLSMDAPRDIDVTLMRVGVAPVMTAQDAAKAVALAENADVALVFAGLSADWDAEGIDRPHLDLPQGQNELIAAIAAVNPRTIVVLQSGCPVTMPWLDKVSAVMQAWYPGQEAGNAIADVLLGKADPGGRLPQTFPHRLEDDPTHINYPGELGHVRYGEGIFIGYRYYEKKKIAPLFPFGFGLSYASFAAAALKLSAQTLAPGDVLTASLEITNSGSRAGATVVQFYIADEKASVARPEKELKGFVKLHLYPGETKTASVRFDMRALAYYDGRAKAWIAEAGRFTLMAGFSSAEIVAAAPFALNENWVDDSPGRKT